MHTRIADVLYILFYSSILLYRAVNITTQELEQLSRKGPPCWHIRSTDALQHCVVLKRCIFAAALRVPVCVHRRLEHAISSAGPIGLFRYTHHSRRESICTVPDILPVDAGLCLCKRHQ